MYIIATVVIMPEVLCAKGIIYDQNTIRIEYWFRETQSSCGWKVVGGAEHADKWRRDCLSGNLSCVLFTCLLSPTYLTMHIKEPSNRKVLLEEKFIPLGYIKDSLDESVKNICDNSTKWETHIAQKVCHESNINVHMVFWEIDSNWIYQRCCKWIR